jgi:hypothetical protein
MDGGIGQKECGNGRLKSKLLCEIGQKVQWMERKGVDMVEQVVEACRMASGEIN